MEKKEAIYVNPYDKHLDYRANLLDIGPRFYMRTKHMFNFFPEHPQRIIDIGCGDGFFLKLLSQKGFLSDGIDASAKAIELCKKRVGHSAGSITCCFIEEFKPKERYDLILCGEVLEHIENDQAFLEQINRLAAIKSILILTVPLDMRLWSKADDDAGHFRRYTKLEIFAKLEQAGFSIDGYVIWGFPLTRYLMAFIRKQQTEMIQKSKNKHAEWKKRLFGKYKTLFKPLKYIFLLDNLFNFTEKGVDIVIKARKTL